MAVGDVDNNRRRWRQALEGDDDGRVLGRCCFGHGGGELPKQRRRTRAVEDSNGVGGGLWDVKRAYHNIALSKATTAQTILRPEGRPDIALHNAINLLHRTQ